MNCFENLWNAFSIRKSDKPFLKKFVGFLNGENDFSKREISFLILELLDYAEVLESLCIDECGPEAFFETGNCPYCWIYSSYHDVCLAVHFLNRLSTRHDAMSSTDGDLKGGINEIQEA